MRWFKNKHGLHLVDLNIKLLQIAIPIKDKTHNWNNLITEVSIFYFTTRADILDAHSYIILKLM